MVDAQDVLFSWDRIKGISTRRGELANDLDPNAPITSISAPDDRTIVIKTKAPTAALLALLSTAIQGLMIIAPKEGADNRVLNLATTVRGSGPWYLDQHLPGARYTFKRNPGFGQDKRQLPYVDEIEWPVLPEYAAAMAQFRTGAVYSFNGALGEDILPLKREIPELTVMATDYQVPLARPFFGVRASSPFRDERVRRAFVMTWDRDLFIDALYNVSQFTAEGVQVETAWELALQANTWKGWFLDAKSKEFGSNSTYIQKDLTEVKKLMTAAGHTSAVTVDNNTPTQVANQGVFDRIVDIITGMVEESGLFRLNRKLSPFNADFIPNYQDVKGNFDGVAFTLSSLTIDPFNYLKAYYHPSGAQRQGTDETFRELIDKAEREFDDKKRQSLLHDVQRHEAETLFFPRVGAATGLQIFWPVLRNVNVWQGGSGRPNATLFLDPTQPPLGRS